MSLRVNRRAIILSVIFYIALSIPMSLFHEFGHVAVCAANGLDYRIWVDARGGYTICLDGGNIANTPLYNMFGGIFGLVGSSAIIEAWIIIKRHIWILAVGLAYIVDQFAKMILEGFMTAAYTSGRIDGYVIAIQLAAWIGFTLYFARIPPPSSQQPTAVNV